MTGTPRQRWLVLGSLLLATLAAAVFVEEDGTEVSPQPRERRAGPATSAAPRPADGKQGPETAETTLALPEFPTLPETALEGKAEAAPLDPFRVTSWVITPPPPPPPAPTAPPLPFKYLGKIVDDGTYVVFLSQQNKNLVAREGDRIGGSYRVEAITASRMTFLYEPLKQQQELAIGGE